MKLRNILQIMIFATSASLNV